MRKSGQAKKSREENKAGKNLVLAQVPFNSFMHHHAFLIISIIEEDVLSWYIHIKLAFNIMQHSHSLHLTPTSSIHGVEKGMEGEG